MRKSDPRVISSDPAVQSHYEACLANGFDPAWAEALAKKRVSVGLRTDATFFAGRMGRQFADKPALGDRYAQKLRASGQSTAGKVYVNQLARFPGDPEAWVGSKGEIAERCRQRGWNCRGEVNVKGDQYADPEPDVVLDPDLVTAEVKQLVAENPELAPTPKEKAELTATLYEKRKPNRRPRQTVVEVDP